ARAIDQPDLRSGHRAEAVIALAPGRDVQLEPLHPGAASIRSRERQIELRIGKAAALATLDRDGPGQVLLLGEFGPSIARTGRKPGLPPRQRKQRAFGTYLP